MRRVKTVWNSREDTCSVQDSEPVSDRDKVHPAAIAARRDQKAG